MKSFSDPIFIRESLSLWLVKISLIEKTHEVVQQSDTWLTTPFTLINLELSHWDSVWNVSVVWSFQDNIFQTDQKRSVSLRGHMKWFINMILAQQCFSPRSVKINLTKPSYEVVQHSESHMTFPFILIRQDQYNFNRYEMVQQLTLAQGSRNCHAKIALLNHFICSLNKTDFDWSVWKRLSYKKQITK